MLNKQHFKKQQSKDISKKINKLLKKIPCGGYCNESMDYGREYDCEYRTGIGCDECIINYYMTGGRTNPITGKEVK
jgi:hypothetical protein